MREVEKLCDRVAIIHKGKVLTVGSLAELRQCHGQDDMEELFFQLLLTSPQHLPHVLFPHLLSGEMNPLTSVLCLVNQA